jgi:hypothetical protein
MSPPSSALYDSWGHSLPSIDPSKVFWVFLQNPNGLNLSGATYSLQHVLRLSHDYGVASLCLPETNLNWDLPHLKSTFSLYYEIHGGIQHILSPSHRKNFYHGP